MSIPIKITNTAPEGARTPLLAVAVVTVGGAELSEAKHVLAPGQSCELTLRPGQFVTADETQPKD